MTHLESIKSNAFLLELNMNKATKEQKIQWLCQIIDNETDKPEDEIDFALIGECSAYLRELSDKAAEATKEQKKRILQQIKAHHNQTATTKSAKVLRPRWKTVRKVVGIAIAAVLLLVSTLTVIAKVKGYSNAWEYVKENIQKIIGLDAGDRVNEGNITLIKGAENISYTSVEELMRTEGYDIYYPAILPDGIEITEISNQIVDASYMIYSIQFTEANLSFMISSKRAFSEKDLKNYELIITANMTFYLKELSNGLYQAVGYDGKYEYIISLNDYSKLIEILNGMKGLET